MIFTLRITNGNYSKTRWKKLQIFKHTKKFQNRLPITQIFVIAKYEIWNILHICSINTSYFQRHNFLSQ